MKKSEAILSILCGFLVGTVVGFLLAPIKKGMEFGNNNGNTTHYHYGPEEEKKEEGEQEEKEDMEGIKEE